MFQTFFVGVVVTGLVIYHCRKPLTRKIINDCVITTNNSLIFASTSVRNVTCLSVTMVYCGQTVGWIRMPLGMEVGLGLGHIVLDGDPAPTVPKWAQ